MVLKPNEFTFVTWKMTTVIEKRNKIKEKVSETNKTVLLVKRNLTT